MDEAHSQLCVPTLRVVVLFAAGGAGNPQLGEWRTHSPTERYPLAGPPGKRSIKPNESAPAPLVNRPKRAWYARASSEVPIAKV